MYTFSWESEYTLNGFSAIGEGNESQSTLDPWTTGGWKGVKDAAYCALKITYNLGWPFASVDSQARIKNSFQSTAGWVQMRNLGIQRADCVFTGNDPCIVDLHSSEIHSLGLSSWISLNFHLFSPDLIWLV